MDECKAPPSSRRKLPSGCCSHPQSRGLHSSTFQLNLSHFVTITTLRITQKVLTLR